jgi:hypothetical protein
LALRFGQVEHDNVGIMLSNNIKEPRFEIGRAPRISRPGERQILSRDDYRRCSHRSLIG